MSRRAALFDLDGTLIDSVADLHIATNRLLHERGRPAVTQEQARMAIGHGARALLAKIWTDTGTPASAELLEDLYRDFLTLYRGAAAVHTRPYPGVVEALAELTDDGWALAVCTNKPEAPAHQILAALDLAHFFEIVLGGDSLPTKKPDPAMLLQALAAMNCTRGAMVGDSEADVGAAHAAGIPVIGVDWGYARGALNADALVSHFAEIPGTLRALVEP